MKCIDKIQFISYDHSDDDCATLFAESSQRRVEGLHGEVYDRCC